MKRTAPTDAATDRPTATCTVCPLLCDDVVVEATAVCGACAAGAAGFATASRLANSVAAATTIDGATVPRAEAIAHAARVIAAARRVLVTGFAALPLEPQALACDLAEAVGAAVDAGATETAQVAGPTIARIGEVTADWDELRDRADLVILWFCDPTPSHPRFIERFVTPPPAGTVSRRIIAIGPHAVAPPANRIEHLPLPEGAGVAAARVVQALVTGRSIAHVPEADPALAEAAAAIHDAISRAACVGIVTVRGGDAVGLEAWAVAALVRTIAHERPAFEVPLAGGIHGPGANLAGTAELLTWRYGAAGAVARADRGGAEFLPAEADAARLVDRGEVDCVIAVGTLAPRLEAAIAALGHRIGLVRVAAPSPAGTDPTSPAIVLACDSPLVRPAGTMLRGDGRRVVLGPRAESPDSAEAVLAALLDGVRAIAIGRKPA